MLQPPLSPWITNSDPAVNPHFLSTLRSSGVLDTSYIFNTGIDAILERYKSGLGAANFTEHASEFCRENGIHLTAPSSIGFFRSEPSSGPFVRLFVNHCPLAHSTTESPYDDNDEGETTWTMVDTDDVPSDRVEYVVQIPSFLHIFVVFEVGKETDDESRSLSRGETSLELNDSARS